MSFKKSKSGLLIPEFNIVVPDTPKILPGRHNLNQMLQARAPRRRFVPLASQQYSDRVLNTQNANLIAYWRLQEGAGGNADNYEGTAARDGTFNGVTLGQTGIGDGLTSPSFDGANDFVDIYSASLNTAWNGGLFSTLIWGQVSGAGIWTDGASEALYRIAVNDGNNYTTIMSTAVNNRLQWHYRAGGVSDLVDLDTVGPRTDFFSAGMSVDAGADEMKAYYEGEQTGATQGGLGVWAGALNANFCDIGAWDQAGTRSWDGNEAHMAVWNVVLTDDEFRNLGKLNL